MFFDKFRLLEEATEGGDGGSGDGGGEGKEENTEGKTEGGEKPPEGGSNENPPEGKENSEKNEKKGDESVDTPTDYTLALDKDSLLNEGNLKSISDFAKEAKMSEADAKKLLSIQEDAVGEHLDAQTKAHTEKVNGWKQDIEGRKEFAAETESVNQALKEYGSEELTKALKESGYRNWQPLWDFVKSVGDAMKDDSFENGKPGGTPKEAQTLGQKMYGNSMKK